MTHAYRRLRRIDRLITEHDKIPDMATAVAVFEGRHSPDDCDEATLHLVEMLRAMHASVPTSPRPLTETKRDWE